MTAYNAAATAAALSHRYRYEYLTSFINIMQMNDRDA